MVLGFRLSYYVSAVLYLRFIILKIIKIIMIQNIPKGNTNHLVVKPQLTLNSQLFCLCSRNYENI